MINVFLGLFPSVGNVAMMCQKSTREGARKFMLFQATVIPVLHDAHVVNAMSLTILTAPAGTFWCGETVWTKNTYPEAAC